ncbi:hypothetical protein HK100_009173 [Physocladia obscura]|uniref:SPT2 chromatin protein n=1 Tax=Physocladia obscura TaxID=109957 RepID=A0AAD5SNS2_9FUNG|nr:hypothetical protein HK100_009173 [Physocladia obscura]
MATAARTSKLLENNAKETERRIKQQQQQQQREQQNRLRKQQQQQSQPQSQSQPQPQPQRQINDKRTPAAPPVAAALASTTASIKPLSTAKPSIAATPKQSTPSASNQPSSKPAHALSFNQLMAISARGGDKEKPVTKSQARTSDRSAVDRNDRNDRNVHNDRNDRNERTIRHQQQQQQPQPKSLISSTTGIIPSSNLSSSKKSAVAVSTATVPAAGGALKQLPKVTPYKPTPPPSLSSSSASTSVSASFLPRQQQQQQRPALTKPSRPSPAAVGTKTTTVKSNKQHGYTDLVPIGTTIRDTRSVADNLDALAVRKGLVADDGGGRGKSGGKSVTAANAAVLKERDGRNSGVGVVGGSGNGSSEKRKSIATTATTNGGNGTSANGSTAKSKPPPAPQPQPKRRITTDSDGDEPPAINPTFLKKERMRDTIWSILGVKRRRFANESDDDETMEAGFDSMRKEESKSARLARLEDEEEEKREKERLKKKGKI